MNHFTVSILMTSYNQAKYIKDAIEGVLMQQTDFEIELLIGEDAGNKDNSLEICREYEKNHPKIIRVIFDGKNHGMVANEQRLINAAKGKYIAFCEADDYWIDPLKLQKQVEVLEGNPEISACASQSRVIIKEDKNNWTLLSTDITDKLISINDLLNAQASFQTASFICRAKNIQQAPALPTKVNGWDRMVFMINALNGDIFWSKAEMAVYRKNETGNSTWVKFETMKRDIDMIGWFIDFSKKMPINALKANVNYGIISNSIVISTYQLLLYYMKFYSSAGKSEIDLSNLKLEANKTLAYRLPKTTRRIFRKIGIIKSYA